MSKYGRIQSAPPLQLHRLHRTADPSTFKEVTWPVAIPVLDQQDLSSQSIDVTTLVKGATAADALGSCTCNAGTAHLATQLAAAGKDITTASLPAADGTKIALSATDSVADEKFAILLYHLVTDQTGDPATEWPPTDSGSSGYYVATELEKLKLAGSYQSGSGILGALSLLQSGTVMQGTPFFMSWETPDSSGFIDGDGSQEALEAAIQSGVAGGHETLIRGIEQLALTSSGKVDLAKTVLRVRNSWSESWGLSGDFLIHASTLDYLAQYVDYKAVTIGTPANAPAAPAAPASHEGILGELSDIVHRAEELGIQDWDALVALLREHHLL